MKDASQFPITFGYGAKDGKYYGPNGSVGPYHKGDDRAMPVGTPVVVNGVEIGKSGSMYGGPHLHTGRWVNGKDTNPNGGGFTLDNAKVTETGENSRDGKFVRINGSGASWVYLHLSKILVKAGDKLEGEDMPTQQETLEHFHAYGVKGKLANGDPSQPQLDYYAAHPWSVLYSDLLNDVHNQLVALQKSSTPSKATVLTPGDYKVN